MRCDEAIERLVEAAVDGPDRMDEAILHAKSCPSCSKEFEGLKAIVTALDSDIGPSSEFKSRLGRNVMAEARRVTIARRQRRPWDIKTWILSPKIAVAAVIVCAVFAAFTLRGPDSLPLAKNGARVTVTADEAAPAAFETVRMAESHATAFAPIHAQSVDSLSATLTADLTLTLEQSVAGLIREVGGSSAPVLGQDGIFQVNLKRNALDHFLSRLGQLGKVDLSDNGEITSDTVDVIIRISP